MFYIYYAKILSLAKRWIARSESAVSVINAQSCTASEFELEYIYKAYLVEG